MNYHPHIEHRLSQALKGTLPGLEAHLHMAPPLFRKFAKTMEVPDSAKDAAVLLLLYIQDGKIFLPFMRRTEDGRVHGGQISFPGGRVENEDIDFTDTALREAHEEIGVLPQEVNVLGSLSEIYIVPSNYRVYPRVAFAEKKPEFIANEEEVAEIIEVELSVLLNPKNRKLIQKKLHTGHVLETPGYHVNDQTIIWGGTSMILAEFLQIFEKIY